MNGLDLFSGIGGIALGLEPWVKPVAYCEIDRYCRSVLLSRILEGFLAYAPIWDDVQTFRGAPFAGKIDIIFGGFPCQDLSVAGKGVGLAGERSGLFFEVLRLVSEIRPSFVFLENVPAIRSRGADIVIGRLASLGYDCRWLTLSAYAVGAPHRRERWWLLAYANSAKLRQQPDRQPKCEGAFKLGDNGATRKVADTNYQRQNQITEISRRQDTGAKRDNWWSVEPDVGRVAHGIPQRVDRIKGLGNAVVPQCAREAFKRLMGL